MVVFHKRCSLQNSNVFETAQNWAVVSDGSRTLGECEKNSGTGNGSLLQSDDYFCEIKYALLLKRVYGKKRRQSSHRTFCLLNWYTRCNQRPFKAFSLQNLEQFWAISEAWFWTPTTSCGMCMPDRYWQKLCCKFQNRSDRLMMPSQNATFQHSNRKTSAKFFGYRDYTAQTMKHNNNKPVRMTTRQNITESPLHAAITMTTTTLTGGAVMIGHCSCHSHKLDVTTLRSLCTHPSSSSPQQQQQQ